MIKIVNLPIGLIAPAIYLYLRSKTYIGATLSISNDFWWYETRDTKKRYYIADLSFSIRPGSLTITLIVLCFNLKLLAGKNIDIDLMETT